MRELQATQADTARSRDSVLAQVKEVRRMMGQGEAANSSLPDRSELRGTLREQLEQAQELLSSAEAERDRAAGDIREALQALHELWGQLGEATKSGFEEVGPDVSQSRLEAVTGEMRAAIAAIRARTIEVTGLANTIVDLHKEVIGLVVLGGACGVHAGCICCAT